MCLSSDGFTVNYLIISIACVVVNSKHVSKDGSSLSGTSSTVSTGSVPPTPRSEGEILQSSNLKCFSFGDLKNATRNFRPDSVLGEGGFGSVFKGWIDEHTFAATKPGTGIVIAVKRLNQEGYQGHREWLVSGQLLLSYCFLPKHRELLGHGQIISSNGCHGKMEGPQIFLIERTQLRYQNSTIRFLGKDQQKKMGSEKYSTTVHNLKHRK